MWMCGLFRMEEVEERWRMGDGEGGGEVGVDEGGGGRK